MLKRFCHVTLPPALLPRRIARPPRRTGGALGRLESGKLSSLRRLLFDELLHLCRQHGHPALQLAKGYRVLDAQLRQSIAWYRQFVGEGSARTIAEQARRERIALTIRPVGTI